MVLDHLDTLYNKPEDKGRCWKVVSIEIKCPQCKEIIKVNPRVLTPKCPSCKNTYPIE